jgi:3-methyladenine DNA glycosylase AlkC
MSANLSPQNEKKFNDRFDLEAAYAWAAQVAAVHPNFDSERFVRKVTRGLYSLGFKGRVQRFARVLEETLPPDYPTALSILVESLPEALPDDEAPADGWLQWPMGEFIAMYGLEHFEDSMEAMLYLTQVSRAEFAVRPFVEHFPEKTFARLSELTAHPDPHVRRWCSEGVRPRLPWGNVLGSLVKDPTPIWPILERLKDDPVAWVRQSVANNLTDIAKDHPGLVVAKCQSWKAGATEERRWLVKHALRDLIKSGHPGALASAGILPPPSELKVELEISPRTLLIGESVRLSARLHNQSSVRLTLEVALVLNFAKQEGKGSGKVFKWKSILLEPGQQVTLRKEHALQEAAVGTLQPGRHSVQIQVNGSELASGYFTLL